METVVPFEGLSSRDLRIVGRDVGSKLRVLESILQKY